MSKAPIPSESVQPCEVKHHTIPAVETCTTHGISKKSPGPIRDGTNTEAFTAGMAVNMKTAGRFTTSKVVAPIRVAMMRETLARNALWFSNLFQESHRVTFWLSCQSAISLRVTASIFFAFNVMSSAGTDER